MWIKFIFLHITDVEKSEISLIMHMRLDMRQDWELLKAGNVGNVGNKVILRPMKE